MINVEKTLFPQGRERSVDPESGRANRLLQAALPHISKSSNQEELVARNTNRILRLLTQVEDSASQREIHNQVQLAVRYILKNKDSLHHLAEKQGGKLYLRPQDYLGAKAGKILSDEYVRPQDAKYRGAHLMISRQHSGACNIDIIPKHPDLWLGSGTYKNVRIAIRFRNKTKYFHLKAFTSAGGREVDSPDAHLKIEREVSLLNKVHSRNDLEKCQCLFFERVVEERSVIKAKTIMPLANRGDLYHYLFEGGFSRDIQILGEDRIQELKYDILESCAEALKQQHDIMLVNADVKLENVLIDINHLGRNNQKITCFMSDLGFAYFSKEASALQSPGTYKYQGPEICDISTDCFRTIIDGQAQDIFSLGIIFYNLLNLVGDAPTYAKKAFSEKKRAHEWLKYAIAWSEDPEGNYRKRLIDMMMHPDPSKRPSIDDVAREVRLFRKGEFSTDWINKLQMDRWYIRNAKQTIDQFDKFHQTYFYFDGTLHESMSPCTFAIGNNCNFNERIFTFKDDHGKAKVVSLNHLLITNREGAYKSLRFTPPSLNGLYVRFLSDIHAFAAYRITDEGVDELLLSACNFEALSHMSAQYMLIHHIFRTSFTGFYDAATINFKMSLDHGRLDLGRWILQNFKFDSGIMLKRAKDLGLRLDDYKQFAETAKRRCRELERRLRANEGRNRILNERNGEDITDDDNSGSK